MADLDLSALLAVARDTVDEATQHVLTHPVTNVWNKANREVVTNVDGTVESLVQTRLYRSLRQIGFLGEETGQQGNPETYWVLDPIDGTINFLRGMPICAIALGLVHNEQPVLGVIALPFLQRTYWAVHGGGAFRDDTRVHAAGTTALSEALIGLSDYGNGRDESERDTLSTRLDHAITAQAQGVRRLGCTAAELAFVADGSLDASITIGNRPWDTAAGAIIAAEAGAAVLDADATPHTTQSLCAIAVAPSLAGDLMPLLAIARETSYWPKSNITATPRKTGSC